LSEQKFIKLIITYHIYPGTNKNLILHYIRMPIFQ